MWGTEAAAGAARQPRGCGRAAMVLLMLLAGPVAAQPTAPAPPPAPPSAPNLVALPQPLARPSVDLEALARGYASRAEAQAADPGLHAGPELIVFVSLSMPRPSLERVLDQAAQAGARVVLRGFVQGSLRQTVTQLQALIGPRRIAVQIDPPAFDRFGITQVPSVVLVRDGTRPPPCAAGHCAPPGEHLRVAGDVSLDYALAHMQRTAPGFQAETARFLARLQR
ncbi:type-F conjugative transfer system pilin assembly protein TrbC [Pseudorhodoferax sp. Leaf267]|uniref:type-F conjugative transfer system pilin assembly protein TrbC n=1 Tax=Pseudorhodoferax sp. Leaf267 TaxID=1736316 RepID=UPI001F204E3B|nr:type-F conjugative transfer system pilin assembly protein TrbC [Pseudorhodoferax sp. Leaf267]